LKLKTQFLLDQAEANDKALQIKLARWKEKAELVLEPGEKPPPGYEAKRYKYYSTVIDPTVKASLIMVMLLASS
jgi:hypothetical protein